MALPRTVILHKKRGKTPLETIHEWKASHPEFANVPTSYAGRLDPMAEGKLLVLIGDECKKQPNYTKLDKEYVIEVLFDMTTDTGDVLGLPRYSAKETKPTKKSLHDVLTHEQGAHSHAYPAFSSKTVNGKPLFLYALEGTLDTIQIPEHIETIYSIQVQSIRTQSTAEVSSAIQHALAEVPRSDEPSKALGADFRQDKIRELWQKQFAEMHNRTFYVLTLRVTCGSGAYMRTLAERIGSALGTSALALSINRTKIGKYVSLGGYGFWIKQF